MNKKRTKTNLIWPILGFAAFMLFPVLVAFAESYQ